MSAVFEQLRQAHPHLPAWASADALVYALELPEETPSNNTIKGLHFHAYKKMREDWRKRVSAAVEGLPRREPVEQAGLVVIRHCVGQLDYDNLYGGLKPLLDCLVLTTERNPSGLGLIVDDNPKNMPEPPYVRQVKTKRGQGRTQLFVFRA